MGLQVVPEEMVAENSEDSGDENSALETNGGQSSLMLQ